MSASSTQRLTTCAASRTGNAGIVPRVDSSDERELSDKDRGAGRPRDLLTAAETAGQRLPQERIPADGGCRQHCRQPPLRRSRASAPCRHDGRGRDRTGRVHGRDAAPERRRARRERHRGERREHGPWRQRPRAIRREQQEEEMADEAEVESAGERRLCRRAFAARCAHRPRVAGERDERQPDDDEERWQDADAAGGLRPPGHHQEPRQDTAHLGHGRQASSGALDKECGIGDGEKQRQRPERGGRHRSEREKEQQAQPEEQHHAATPRRLERTRHPASDDRSAERHEAERDVDGHCRIQALERQVHGRPYGLRGNGEERRDVVQRPAATRHGSPGDQHDERQQRAHERPRRHKRGLNRRKHRERCQEERPGIVRPGGRAGKGPRKPSRDERRDEVEDREERGETDRGKTLTGYPMRGHNPGPDPHRHPRRHDEHRGKGADRVEETLTTGDCDRQEPDVDEDQESEQERRTRTVRGDGGEVKGKQQRHRR